MLSEVCMRYSNVRSLREHVRIVFNRMEGKLEVVVLKESGSVRVVPNPFLKFIRLQLGKWSKILR
jgi:hypothetical protein